MTSATERKASLSNAYEILNEAGFSSWKEYRESEVWNLIKHSILQRDIYQCRIQYCKGYAESVAPLQLSPRILLGKSPASLISVCCDCQNTISYDKDGLPRSIFDQLKLAEAMVIGTTKHRGLSNPKLGRWYGNQLSANEGVRRTLAKELEKLNV